MYIQNDHFGMRIMFLFDTAPPKCQNAKKKRISHLPTLYTDIILTLTNL